MSVYETIKLMNCHHLIFQVFHDNSYKNNHYKIHTIYHCTSLLGGAYIPLRMMQQQITDKNRLDMDHVIPLCHFIPTPCSVVSHTNALLGKH